MLSANHNTAIKMRVFAINNFQGESDPIKLVEIKRLSTQLMFSRKNVAPPTIGNLSVLRMFEIASLSSTFRVALWFLSNLSHTRLLSAV